MKVEPLDTENEYPKVYEEISDFQEVNIKLEDLLAQYNSENIGREMNLVLFNDAMDHLVRLNRIISFPKGHALLVGYGGSGKKSLTRLTTFILGYKLFEIQLKRNYKELNFREDLEHLFCNLLVEN